MGGNFLSESSCAAPGTCAAAELTDDWQKCKAQLQPMHMASNPKYTQVDGDTST